MTNAQKIEKSVKILRNGGLVAFPTETVYGLGADASQADAIAKIYAAKERPANHPLIVHVADVSQLEDWAENIPDIAYQLAGAFWPGPMTLILQKKPSVLDSLTAGQQTVGLRIPNHPIALKLLKAFGSGVAAPSANKFTHISPTTAEAVRAELGDEVDMILDGGPSQVGLESTIIDLSGSKPRVLRPGMLGVADIESALQQKVAYAKPKSEVIAPGQHHIHYAPTTATFLCSLNELKKAIREFQSKKIALLVRSQVKTPSHHNVIIMPDNAKDYAHELYHKLRLCDQTDVDFIFIEAVPNEAEWDAIRDRIKKASGRR